MRRPILNNSSPGQAVYDPLLGSGTTLIAAETTGRACLAIELDPLYVDVAIRRWQAFTGAKAILVDKGQPFDEVEKERLPGNGASCDSAPAKSGSAKPRARAPRTVAA